jgi:cysteine desulfurase
VRTYNLGVIYLDHAATSPVRREALDAMLPILTENWGNPSSPHAAGRRARAALDEAREHLAERLNADPRELVLTSGGTEAINLAIKGAAWAGKASGNRIVTSAVEHHAVLNSCATLEKFGFEVAILPVDRYGRVEPDQLTAALNEKTILVSLQLANNEVGTLQPIAELVRRARAQRGALIHVDAVQAAASLDIDVRQLDVDLISIASHKLEGPRGAGLLWLRRGTAILPQTHGGTQERYRRAGTEDVAAAVGMAAAYDLACAERAETGARLRRQREQLRMALLDLSDVEVTGHPRSRLPGLLSLVVGGVDGDALVQALDLEGVCCSTGSACTTGSMEPSHVLTAMGFPDEEARGALRLSLGRTSTDAEIEQAAALIPRVIERVRTGSTSIAAEGLGPARSTMAGTFGEGVPA